MTQEPPQDPEEEIAFVQRDDGDPTTPDDFLVTGAEGLSNRDLLALVASLQSTISGLRTGMSTITVGMNELLGAEGHHRVMEKAMAENVEAWTHVARALSPGQFSLPEEKAAALRQVRELLARGEYGSVPIIPRDRPRSAATSAVGVKK